ncbi:RNA polymerase II degradation factor 1-like isoform X2 [Leguminivora glycinivorella]|uniref:RNA polymerase II degradation factor 1-like isoform X2 n=1 Tax=Leguminivora glycinivorella TaxID=1035111 RepID=UPI00200E4AAD|nr:RNA polymerase II degradation factor 1-like isoform X2 [Leguminivora glycinivorella]
MSSGLLICVKQNKFFWGLYKSKGSTIKADQINVLRKQYDAFLEEDKKRKERNEHILEKLDNMRLSNTVARYKPNVYLDQRLTFKCIGEVPNDTHPHPQTDQPAMVNPLKKFRETAPTDLGLLSKPMDETLFLKEISKKYILIPKLTSIAGVDYIPRAITQDNNNDGDWKSKYSILDKLKQNEKEETNSFSVLKDNGKTFLDDIPTKDLKYRFDDEGSSPKDDQKDEIADRVRACQDKDGTLNITTDINKESTIRKPAGAPNLNTHSVVFNTDTYSGVKQPDQSPAGVETPTHQYDYPTQEVSGAQLASQKTGGRHDSTYNDKHENEDSEKLSPVVNDIMHVEEIDPIKPETHETKSYHLNAADSEKLQYPIDIINVQDFTPAEGVKLVDGVNINPESNAAVQQTYLAPNDQNATQASEHAYQPAGHQPQGDVQQGSQPTISSEEVYLPGVNQPSGDDHYVSEPTAAGEQVYLPGDQQPPSGDQYVSQPLAAAAEQQQHVTENTEQHQPNTYDPTGELASEIQAFEDEQNQMFYSEQANYQDYNQDSNIVDGYSADTNYDPLALYGSVQQQAAYPVEINEHEETSQRYDPCYEEQYAAREADQMYTEQQQYSEQQYAEQQYSDQQYPDQQQYSDKQYTEQQQYDGQQYGEQQQYAEQQGYTDQQQGEPIIATLQEYDEAYTLQEQTMEQIEQQLDEELNVPSQGSVGDIVDESTMYTQNEGVAAEQHVENLNPQPITPKV